MQQVALDTRASLGEPAQRAQMVSDAERGAAAETLNRRRGFAAHALARVANEIAGDDTEAIIVFERGHARRLSKTRTARRRVGRPGSGV
ncbi:MAG: hypothetical protein ACXVAN_07300 [Polyangia bacterium]